MRCVFLFATLFFFSKSYSQYYYNDIVANSLSNQQFKLIKQAKIKTIKAISYDPNGEVTEGFTIEQQISKMDLGLLCVLFAKKSYNFFRNYTGIKKLITGINIRTQFYPLAAFVYYNKFHFPSIPYRCNYSSKLNNCYHH